MQMPTVLHFDVFFVRLFRTAAEANSHVALFLSMTMHAHIPPGRHRPCCMMHSIGTHLTILPNVTNDPGSNPDQKYARRRDRQIYKWEEYSNNLGLEQKNSVFYRTYIYRYIVNVGTSRLLVLTIRLLMSYIYGAPILDVSRSYTTTQHSR